MSLLFEKQNNAASIVPARSRAQQSHVTVAANQSSLATQLGGAA